MSNTMTREDAKVLLKYALIAVEDINDELADTIKSALAILAPEPVEIPWKAMTPDAVFEDESTGVEYLIDCGGFRFLTTYSKADNEFEDDSCVYHTRESVTHYARITEPR